MPFNDLDRTTFDYEQAGVTYLGSDVLLQRALTMVFVDITVATKKFLEQITVNWKPPGQGRTRSE